MTSVKNYSACSQRTEQTMGNHPVSRFQLRCPLVGCFCGAVVTAANGAALHCSAIRAQLRLTRGDDSAGLTGTPGRDIVLSTGKPPHSVCVIQQSVSGRLLSSRPAFVGRHWLFCFAHDRFVSHDSDRWMNLGVNIPFEVALKEKKNITDQAGTSSNSFRFNLHLFPVKCQ